MTQKLIIAVALLALTACSTEPDEPTQPIEPVEPTACADMLFSIDHYKRASCEPDQRGEMSWAPVGQGEEPDTTGVFICRCVETDEVEPSPAVQAEQVFASPCGLDAVECGQ